MRRKSLTIGLFSCLFLTACTATTITYTTSPIYTMDTVVSLKFYNVKDYKKHYAKVKTIFQSIDKVSNDFESGGDITSIYDINLNREGDVSDSLLHLLEASLTYMEDTNGYFNPFIGELSHLWKESLKTEEIPQPLEIEEALEKMKGTSLKIEGNHITLVGDGCLDLGGIAKGYAVEEVRKYFKEENITSYLLDAGNSSNALGTKNGSNFQMALLNPNSNPTNPKYIGILKGKDMVISTSSPQYQYFIKEDVKYHHLLNPFTGYPMNTFDSVFVINSNALEGDIYSTALFSMDKATAISFALEKEVSIILFKGDEILYQSEGVDFQ